MSFLPSTSIQWVAFISLLLPVLAFQASAGPNEHFSRFFRETTLRVDYFHSGTKGSESFGLDQAVEEGVWPGSRVNLIDTLNLGEYLVRIYDLGTNQLIYSRGYSTIFNEWQTTNEALAGYVRTFSESVRFPMPKGRVHLAVARRDKRMILHELWSTVIDPNDPHQIRKEKISSAYGITALQENGDPSRKVDIVILGDGYAKQDMEKFRKDAKHLNDVLMRTQPFSKRKSDFNVWTVEVESEESGIDVPDRGIWKRNALGTSYSTFALPRYVLTMENKILRTVAASVPYDFICILVNDKRYGGGGIYNLYASTYTGEMKDFVEWQQDYMYVHEFGHSFGGLADEYYTSTTQYNDMYQAGVEPWEPNITALLDPANVKWKAHLTPGIEVPTPWERVAYDSLTTIYNVRMDRLAPDYFEKREPLYRAAEKILKESTHSGKVGVFEGAGYAAKGLYRPAVDCRMFSLSTVDFDPVCSAAIERVIDFYSR